MAEKIDLLVENAHQVCVVPSPGGGPQRGEALGTLGVVENGAVAIADGLIVEVGGPDELAARYDPRERLDAGGKEVIPGFVDPHPPLAGAGDRALEVARHIEGAPYTES